MANPETGCTCGSGGHPRECKLHPAHYRLHLEECNIEAYLEEGKEANAALGRLDNAIRDVIRWHREREQYWKMCFDAVSDATSVGVYMAATIGPDGKETPRTQFGEGWNACAMAILQQLCVYSKKCEEASDTWKMIVELVANEEVMWGSDRTDGRSGKDILGPIHLRVSDTFYWACADSEEITEMELPEVYAAWKADPKHGTIKWCMKKRNAKPIAPVIERMKKAGAWEAWMDALEGTQ